MKQYLLVIGINTQGKHTLKIMVNQNTFLKMFMNVTYQIKV